VAGVEVTRQGKRDQNLLTIDERRDTRGRPYYWIGFQRERGNPPTGTDLRAAFEKRISVTPLHMNLTQLEAIEPLRVALEKT
jgi:5'-nucleotidase